MDTKSAPPHRRGHWGVRTSLGPGQVHAHAHVAVGEQTLLRQPTWHELHAWARDPSLWPRLLEMYEAAYGHGTSMTLTQASRAWVVDRIQEAFQKRYLVLIDHHLPSTDASGSAIPRDADQPKQKQKEDEDEGTVAVATLPREKKTWFRARLVDEDGQPMAGENYVVIDTDGAKRQGKLDANGEIYIPPILPPGNCTISFPNIHLNPRKRK